MFPEPIQPKLAWATCQEPRGLVTKNGMFAFSVGDFTERNITLNMGLILTEVRTLSSFCCKTLLLSSVQEVRGPKANFTVSTSYPLIKYFHIKSVLTSSPNVWTELDQCRKEGVLHVLFCVTEKVEESLVPYNTGQVRAEGVKRRYRALISPPCIGCKLRHWVDGVTVWFIL